jgi:putative exosortase-associated protein (TIGR04073 family)
MRKTLSYFAALALLAALASGCANIENKLGRGLANTFEVVRGGEFRRTSEEAALFESPDTSYSTGFVRGIDRTLARTGIGLIEIVTAPIPLPGVGYGPMCTDYLSPTPVYPDNYTPGMMAGSMYETDTYLGYGGGDVAPFVPGSRFSVFDTH